MKSGASNSLNKARVRIFKALAHPSRVLMLEEIARGERCVCELQQIVGADMSTVSKHLTILRTAGLVEDEKRGTQVFYRIRLRCALNFMRCVDATLRANARAQMAELKG